MPKSFRSALIEALDRTGLPLKTVAERACVSYEQLKKVKQRETASTNVDDAVKVANFFGVSLDEFLDDDTATIRSDVVGLYSRLTDEERDFLRAAAVGRRALDLGEAE